MDNMNQKTKTKRVRLYVEAEIIEEQESTTYFRLLNGFGDPVVRFANDKIRTETEDTLAAAS